MEERRTAAWVLGVIFIWGLFFFKILPAIQRSGTQTLAFKDCKVNFKYFDRAFDYDVQRIAHSKLARCLCETYQKKPDTAVANEIKKEYSLINIRAIDSLTKNGNLDSIIKYKSEIFDTVLAID